MEQTDRHITVLGDKKTELYKVEIMITYMSGKLTPVDWTKCVSPSMHIFVLMVIWMALGRKLQHDMSEM